MNEVAHVEEFVAAAVRHRSGSPTSSPSPSPPPPLHVGAAGREPMFDEELEELIAEVMGQPPLRRVPEPNLPAIAVALPVRDPRFFCASGG
jgi:hypothetical protein